VTLENSTDDWCIALLAGVLHKPEDRALFLKRAATIATCIARTNR